MRNDPPRRPGQHGTATRSRPPPTVSPHTLRGYGPCVLPDDGGGYGIGWQGWEPGMGGPASPSLAAELTRCSRSSTSIG